MYFWKVLIFLRSFFRPKHHSNGSAHHINKNNEPLSLPFYFGGKLHVEVREARLIWKMWVMPMIFAQEWLMIRFTGHTDQVYETWSGLQDSWPGILSGIYTNKGLEWLSFNIYRDNCTTLPCKKLILKYYNSLLWNGPECTEVAKNWSGLRDSTLTSSCGDIHIFRSLSRIARWMHLTS